RGSNRRRIHGTGHPLPVRGECIVTFTRLGVEGVEDFHPNPRRYQLIYTTNLSLTCGYTREVRTDFRGLGWKSPTPSTPKNVPYCKRQSAGQRGLCSLCADTPRPAGTKRSPGELTP
ncbi:MAG: hypothetical protein ACRDQU_07585, partial [Pseudonocardiaceae bacterium]